MASHISDLVYIPKPNPAASIRLVCFPYAGGSASTYLPWMKYLGSNIELAVVQLPGRAIRLSEKPYDTMMELVQQIVMAFKKKDGRPSVFFGHSMGAVVAYEVMLMLYKLGHRMPEQLIASGCAGPSIAKSKNSIHNLPDDEFIAKIGELNGTPNEVIENNEMTQLFLPALRADFKVVETYRCEAHAPLPVKVGVLAGKDDTIQIPELEAWFSLFEVNMGVSWFPGAHFFIDTCQKMTVEAVTDLIWS